LREFERSRNASKFLVMKSRLSLAIALLSVAFISCTKSHDFDSSTSKQLIENQWSIQMNEAGQDISSSYASYVLLFAENGSVAVQNAQEITVGKWVVTGDGHSNTSLSLQFNSQVSCMEKLSNSWVLETSGSSQIAFRKTGGDGIMTLKAK